MTTPAGSDYQNISYLRPGFSLESEARTITNHCIQRLSERYLLDLTYQELNNIKKLIKTGYYILIRVEDNKVRILTRYQGRYITFVPQEATNYGWGVKIRTFVAYDNAAAELGVTSKSPCLNY